MESFRGIQTLRLKHLSISSRSAEDLIRSKLETAESILKLWRMSQSLETEKEQLLPFSSNLDEACLTNGLEHTFTQSIPEEASEDQESAEEKTVKVGVSAVI